MSERKPLTFQEFKDYLGNGCVEALDYGLCSDDLGPDVPDTVKDTWDDLRHSWDSLMSDIDRFEEEVLDD